MADVNDLVEDIPADEVVEAPQTGEKPDEAPQPEEKAPIESKAPAPTPEQKQKRDVPLAVFLEEKKHFTKAIEERDGKIAELNARLERLENPAKPEPDYATDPKGYIAHATKAAAQEVIGKLEETRKDIGEVKDATKQTREEQAHTKFLSDVASAEESFVQSRPDYYDALAHVRKIHVAQIREFAPDATDEQIMQKIGNDELAMARAAIQQGRNPSEIVYRMAAHYGYKAPTTQELLNAHVERTGAKPGKEIEGVPEIKEKQKLAPDLTLGNSNGNAPSGDEPPDPESYDPFEAAISEMFGKKRA